MIDKFHKMKNIIRFQKRMVYKKKLNEFFH